MRQLERLSLQHSCVLEVNLADDLRTVELMEACDLYYIQSLDKIEFGELIEELKELHSKMVAP